MGINVYLSFIIYFVLQLEVNGQVVTETNQVDVRGQRKGLWIEQNGLIEAYYSAGLKNGFFKSYNRKNGKLSSFGEFSEGKKCGVWYYFDEKSFLIVKELNIRENNEFEILRDDGVEVRMKYISCTYFFYTNGRVKEEGQVLYNDDIEIDFVKIGEWKYYDDKGNLTKIKNY